MSVIFNTNVGTVTGQTYTGIGPTVPITTDSIRFLSGAAGTFVNCIFDGVVQFGPNAPGDTLPDFSSLRFEGCEFRGSIRGACSGVYINGHGTIQCHSQMSGGILLGGDDITIEDCDFTFAGENAASNYVGPTGTNAYGLEFGSWGYGRSSRRNKVLGCTFRGARQESVGWDSPASTANRSVEAQLSDGLVFIGGGSLDDVVGQHLYCAIGSHEGSYYEITGQDGNALILDVSEFGTPDAGDFVVIAPAFVDSEWANNVIHVDGQVFQSRYGPLGWLYGWGCNSGFCFWGQCFGNYIHDNEVIADGDDRLPANFGYDMGVAVTTAGSYACNAHNRWEDNTFTEARTSPTGPLIGLGVGFAVNDPDAAPESMFPPEAMTPVVYGNYGCEVVGNDFGSGKVRLAYAHEVTLTGNTGSDISMVCDGYLAGDQHGYMWFDDAVPSGFYDTFDTSGTDEYGWPFKQYYLPIGFRAPVTFAAQDVFIDRGYDLLLEVLQPEMRCYGSVMLLTEVVGAVTSSLPAAGVVDVGALPVGEVTSDIEVAGQSRASVVVYGAAALTTRFRGFDLLLDVLASITSVRGRVEVSCRADGLATVTMAPSMNPVVVKPPEGHIIHTAVKPHITTAPRGGARVRQHRVGKGITIE
jgi:hypothetical protein